MNEVPEPVINEGVEEFASSEELQRAHRDSFINKKAKEAEEKQLNSKQKVIKLLDNYIAKHSNTKDVRDMAKKDERTADYQLDLSADIVTILEKIKSELR